VTGVQTCALPILCLRGTIAQANDSILRCEKLNELKKTMHEKIVSGSIRMHTIIEGLFEFPILTIPSIRDRMEVSYPTAKADIQALIQAGIIKKIENERRPALYYSIAIFDIAYADEIEEN